MSKLRADSNVCISLNSFNNLMPNYLFKKYNNDMCVSSMVFLLNHSKSKQFSCILFSWLL